MSDLKGFFIDKRSLDVCSMREVKLKFRSVASAAVDMGAEVALFFALFY